MEDIIGILAVLAFGIIKIIGKYMNDTGNKPVETYVPVEDDPLPETKASAPYSWPIEPEPVAPKPVEEHKPAVVRPSPVRPAAPKASTIEVVERQTKAKQTILIEEEEKGPKEKIDPKKLVLYSEIMTPKFNE